MSSVLGGIAGAVMALALLLILLFMCWGIILGDYFTRVGKKFRFWPCGHETLEGIPLEKLLGRAKDCENSLAWPWLAEGLITLTLPWICFIAGVCVAPFLGRVPGALLLLCTPQLLRVKLFELADMSVVREKSKTVPYAQIDAPDDTCCTKFKRACGRIMDFLQAVGRSLTSSLEVVDAASDGLAVAKAWNCTALVAARFHAAWEGAAWPWGPMMTSMGAGGAMLLALVYTTICQLGALVWSNDGPQGVQGAIGNADFAGAGSLAHVIQQALANSETGLAEIVVFQRTLLTGGIKVITENALQLFLQTSLIAAEGKGLLSDKILAASVILSYLMLWTKWVGLIQFIPKVRDCEDSVLLGFVVVPLGSLLLYMAAKLYYMETCPSHAWGISTGCIGKDMVAS